MLDLEEGGTAPSTCRNQLEEVFGGDVNLIFGEVVQEALLKQIYHQHRRPPAGYSRLTDLRYRDNSFSLIGRNITR